MKLSIIMPLYNVEQTIHTALDSVLMQDVNFEYEIICIDDASTDNTLNILNDYATQYIQVKVFSNPKNMGNGPTFVHALKQAQGDYFTVLDGDDFYTVKNKLQKQVDFLDYDKKKKYCAVCHKYLTLHDNQYILHNPALFDQECEFSYSDFILGKFYAHTSTFMYRNIFKEKISPFFDQVRGDMARTFIVLNYTQGKVKFLNFIGSVYRYNNEGIWSTLSERAQMEMNNTFWKKCADFCSSKEEKELFNKRIYDTSALSNKPGFVALKTLTFEQCFKHLRQMSLTYAFQNEDFVFLRTYKSEFMDSFTESLGRIELNLRGLSPLNKIEPNDNIAISVAMLNNTGGGIYKEIHELIQLNSDKNVYVIFSEITSKEGLSAQIQADFASYAHVKLLFCKEQGDAKLKCLFDMFLDYNISKVYHYAGHHFTYNAALIQQGIYKNITVFSIDHGFVLALDNSSVDSYITKTPAQYRLLNNSYAKKAVYIPVFGKAAEVGGEYIPLNKHENLITATASARFYKFNNNELDYSEFIVALLKTTQGVHYHYGPIDEDKLSEIHTALENNQLDKNTFVHISWADNLCQDMLHKNVDLFISSFPKSSAKTLISIFSAGIPLICYRGDKILTCCDFVYPEALYWSNHQEFLTQIQNLTKEKLLHLSAKGKEHFHKNNNIEILADFLRQEKQFTNDIPQVFCWDTHVVDISQDPYFFPPMPLEIHNPEPHLSAGSRLKNKLSRIYHLSRQLAIELFFLRRVKQFVVKLKGN